MILAVATRAGDAPSDAEIYEPATGRFSPAGPLPSVRHDALAVRLPDGRVVIFERAGVTAFSSPARSTAGAADIYDPTTGTFRAAGPTPHVAATATLLPDGRVYLTGGWDGGEATWAGIYDALTGRTTDAAAPRSSILTPVALADGRILFVYDGSAEAAVFRLEQKSPSPGNP
jgi:hypothetical protein